ncbi:MAG TPA: hypothetical protein VHX65_16920 [Pirellulales bacterium]|jgi:hypothetical protein|nr:hypothetical protein [Pirellulales bacterium]
MADPFAPAISEILTAQSFQCEEVSLAKYRFTDPKQPTVYIAPAGKPVIGFIAFQTKSIRQAYDIVYVYPNQLKDSLAANDVFTFKAKVIEYFQGLDATMKTAGAWNTTVADVTDYDKPLFTRGYTYSHCRVLVDYLSD